MQHSLETIQDKHRLRIIFSRPETGNTLTRDLLHDINTALDNAQHNPDIHIITLEGQQGIFCSGMDLQQISVQDAEIFSQTYFDLLLRLINLPKFLVALVDGKATAGGLGLLAASDIVLATPHSQFSLSEALWGLIPACVTPFLIRRIGFQKAYAMTLTTLPISATEAEKIQLVDTISATPERALVPLLARAKLIQEETRLSVKRYFNDLYPIDESTRQKAISAFQQAISGTVARQRLSSFQSKGKLPWIN